MAHIGSKATGQFGFIKSITYTVNEQGDWDLITKGKSFRYYPILSNTT